MIELDNITYSYPRSSASVLQSFSARFQRGEITLVKGKNGCGKTTLTKLIVGILRPSAGRIAIEGADISGMTLFEIGQRVGYIFQNPNRQLFCDTVFNEIAYGLRNLNMDEEQAALEADHYIELFDLERYRDTYPGKLSLGEKQRLALATVLALGADYLVLDEPTTGLDIRRQRDLVGTLLSLRDEKNCGIVLVGHSSDYVSRCADRELVMR